MSGVPEAERRRFCGAAACSASTSIFRMGGAQAIAALAFGTETVPKVDRIVGPGNIYVAAAKKLIAGEVGIDFVAGPTEIVIIAAEGDPKVARGGHAGAGGARCGCLRDSADHFASAGGGRGRERSKRQLRGLPTAAVARQSIDSNSAIVVVDSLEQAVEFSNAFAPEHLSIPSELPPGAGDQRRQRIHRAVQSRGGGRLCVGSESRVCRLRARRRLRGGLSAADFVKVISVQELTREALREADAGHHDAGARRGLEAHARSVEVRMNHD